MSCFLIVVFLYTVIAICTTGSHFVFQWIRGHISLVHDIHTGVLVFRGAWSAVQAHSWQHLTVTSKGFLQHTRWCSNLLCQILFGLGMAYNFLNATISVLFPRRLGCYAFSRSMYCGVVQTANIEASADLRVRWVFVGLRFGLTVPFIWKRIYC